MKLKDLKKQIALLAGQFRLSIEAACDGFDPDKAASLGRRQRAFNDFEYFARTYFPHYIKRKNALLHDYLYKRLPQIVDSPEGQHEAIAAPRGNAKSTLVSQIFIIWCSVTGRKHYPLIIMDAFEQAATMLEAIKAELEFNPRLLMDFPNEAGRGRVWQVGVILTANDVKIQVFGSGKRMRGLRHGPYRPDLAVGDDLENDENVRSPEQRDKLENWLKKTVLSLGPADDTMDVIIIGTILHNDSVLARLLRNPLWKRRLFKAILTWPDRMDMWDHWEELLLNSDDEGAAADAYYAANKEDMERGAVICWPDGQPLIKLMLKRARDGHTAFDSEQQNDPVSGEDQVFGKIEIWVNRLKEWVFYGACDPSLGKKGNNRRDPSAILVGGYNRFGGIDKKTPILDVVEARIRKRLPDQIIEDIIALQREYNCVLWAFEVVQFQEFLRTELLKRSALRRVPVPAKPVQPHDDKMLRIESIQPYVAAGQIRLGLGQTTLEQQLKHFPKADHDDGPDALEMLWQLTVRHAPGSYTSISDYLRELRASGQIDDDDYDGGAGAF